MHVKRLLQKIGWYREPANYTYLPDENHIELLNFWTSQPREEIWLYQFILQHIGSRLSKDNGVLLSSVFGPRNAIKESRSRIKVFFTGENVRRFHEYRDHCLNDVDISLGFDDINIPNTSVFPFGYFIFSVLRRHSRKSKMYWITSRSPLHRNAASVRWYQAMIKTAFGRDSSTHWAASNR